MKILPDNLWHACPGAVTLQILSVPLLLVLTTLDGQWLEMQGSKQTVIALPILLAGVHKQTQRLHTLAQCAYLILTRPRFQLRPQRLALRLCGP